jgi:molybdate transport system substrate-binding protein
MKLMYLSFALLFCSLAPLCAQPSIPAKPADPNQARPALPVVPDSITPPQPETPETPSTNAAPAVALAPISVAVIAESSLKQVLQELAQTWADNQDSSPQMPLTLTNSGTIRARVESGTPCDVVISADVADMKAMTEKGLLSADGQISLARNTLVVYGRKALVKDDDLDWFDLVGSEWKKVALGNPDLVASGRVAQRALQKHGLINDDNKDVFTYAQTDALAFGVVQREQADAVFAYKTDAAKMHQPGFEIVEIKTEDAPPVFYTAAVSRSSKNQTMARSFIDYCTSEAAKPVWAKYGFETN